MNSPKEAQERIETLSDELTLFHLSVFFGGTPKLSDTEYGDKFQELVDLEIRFPEFRRVDSPTIPIRPGPGPSELE